MTFSAMRESSTSSYSLKDTRNNIFSKLTRYLFKKRLFVPTYRYCIIALLSQASGLVDKRNGGSFQCDNGFISLVENDLSCNMGTKDPSSFQTGYSNWQLR